MRFGKHHICVVRTKPRHPADAQRPVLDAAGCGDWVSLDEPDGVQTLIERLRRNDHVKLRYLHLLAPPKRRTDDNPRRELWRLIHAIEDRGAIIVEVSTGRTTANQRERDMMIADAIEVVTRGARAAAARSRQNGKSGGRPPAEIKDQQRDAARRLWFEKPHIQGKWLRQALGRSGYSLARCYREFGPRGGRS